MYKLYSVIELVALKWRQMYRLIYRIWWRTIPLLISTEVEEFYDIIRDVHEKELLHGGYKKTFDKVQSLVAYVSCY